MLPLGTRAKVGGTYKGNTMIDYTGLTGTCVIDGLFPALVNLPKNRFCLDRRVYLSGIGPGRHVDVLFLDDSQLVLLQESPPGNEVQQVLTAAEKLINHPLTWITADWGISAAVLTELSDAVIEWTDRRDAMVREHLRIEDENGPG